MTERTGPEPREEPREPSSMRVGFRVPDVTPERLRYCKQLGVDDVVVSHRLEEGGPETLTIRGDRAPTVEELTGLRERVEAAGLRLVGVDSLSREGVYDDVMFGREGRERQVETIETLVRNMGEAGLPVLGYQWRAAGVHESVCTTTTVRGGATVSEIDLSLDPDYAAPIPSVDREYTEAEFWDNYEWFLDRVIPVAEEAGVRLAVHPDDPPVVERLGGTPRILRDFETHRHAVDLYDSAHHGLKLCLGCFSEMGEDVVEVVRHFGERDRLVFLHVRDVVGTMPRFHETFHDDPEGNYDEYDLLATLDDVGFDGIMLPDHYPVVEGDTDWQHRSRAFAAGYLRGLVNAVTRERRDGTDGPG